MSVLFNDYIQNVESICSRERVKMSLLCDRERTIGRWLKNFTMMFTVVASIIGVFQYSVWRSDELDILTILFTGIVGALIKLRSHLKPDKRRADASQRAGDYEVLLTKLDRYKGVATSSDIANVIMSETDDKLANLLYREDLPSSVVIKYAELCKKYEFDNDLETLNTDIKRIKNLVVTPAVSTVTDSKTNLNPSVVASINRLTNRHSAINNA